MPELYLITQELPEKGSFWETTTNYKTIAAENCCRQCSSYLNIFSTAVVQIEFVIKMTANVKTNHLTV